MANPLARLVMDNVSKKVGTREYKEYGETYEVRCTNLIKEHEDMIRRIINGNKIEVSTGRRVMTLDELASRIKGNSQ